MMDKVIFAVSIFLLAVFIGSFFNLLSLKKGFFKTLWTTLTVVPVVFVILSYVIISAIVRNLKSPIICFVYLMTGFMLFPALTLELADEPVQDVKTITTQLVISYSSLSAKKFKSNAYNI